MPPYADSPQRSLSVLAERDRALLAEADAILEAARREADRRGLRLVTSKFGVGKRRRACLNPWFKTYVTCEQFVTPCSRFFDPAAVSFGNLAQDRFMSIWHGPAYTAMRRRMREGSRPYAQCVEARQPVTLPGRDRERA
jgi:hypothetical protein